MSHFRTYHTVLKTQDDYINALRSARYLTKEINQRLAKVTPPHDPPITVFPYSIFYVFFEQYLGIQELATMVLGLALAAIFTVTWLFLGHPYMALLVTMHIAALLVHLAAVMAWWGINLNALSVVNMVAAAGISVEFCSHVARAFLVTPGSRNRKAYKALCETGSSVSIVLQKQVLDD